MSPLLGVFLATLAVIHASSDGRIIGGSTVEIKSYPYQISLQRNGKHMCGGAIISENFVVTAAHCVQGAFESMFKIRAGSSYHARGGQVVPVSKFNIHPQYNNTSLDYDIAVIKLSHSLKYNILVQPVEVVKANGKLPVGSIGKISGWGYTKTNGNQPDQLQALNVPLLAFRDCKRYIGEALVTERMMCAGYLNGGKDSCQGDSGGPLVINNKLAGVISWGIECAQPNHPGIYTNLTVVRSFIKTIANV